MSVLPISFLHSFLFPFLLPFTMAFVPRRSPRLTQTPAAPATPLRTKEQAREIVRTISCAYTIDPEHKKEFISTTTRYMDRLDTIKNNRARKARVVISLCEYMIQNPFMLAAYPQLTTVLRWKMEVMQKEHIRNLDIRQAFQKAVADLLFVVS